MAMTPKQRPARGAAGQIAEERLKRLQNQNAKLLIEIQRLRGEVGPIEEFKQEVLRANAVVKTQLLALPYRLSSQMASATDERECTKLMEAAIVQACNDLAFEREQPPETCPTCGGKV